MPSDGHAFLNGDEAGLNVGFAIDFHKTFKAHAHEAIRRTGASVHGVLAGVLRVGVAKHGGGDTDPRGNFQGLSVKGNVDGGGSGVLHGVFLVQQS